MHFPLIICAAIMDVKVVFVVVCLYALAISSTEAGIPKCCIKTRKILPGRMLAKVYYVKYQNGSSACDITALQLFLRGRDTPICVSPQLEKMVRRQVTIKNRFKASASDGDKNMFKA